MAEYLGIDWSAPQARVAAWMPDLKHTIGIDWQKEQPSAELRVAVRDVAGMPEVHFPVPAQWLENDDDDTLIFENLSAQIPSLHDSEAATLLARPVLQQMRSLVQGEDVRLAIAAPLEYSSEHCESLQRAGQQSGFQQAFYLNATQAAILAQLPVWAASNPKLKELEAGRCLWVVESVSLHLNLALVHVRWSAKHGLLDFAFLAGDRLNYLGIIGDEDAAAVESALNASFDAHRQAAFGKVWKGWEGTSPSLQTARGIIPVGSGKNLETAVEKLAAKLKMGGESSGPVEVFRRIPSDQVVAHGAAVHAAIQSGVFPYPIGHQRRVDLGLWTRVQSEEDPHFTPIAVGGVDPPFKFQRAFRLARPLEGGAELELTIAASLPGGDRACGVQTFLIGAEKLAGIEDPVILLQGELRTWSGGQAGVTEMRSGRNLGSSVFQLP